MCIFYIMKMCVFLIRNNILKILCYIGNIIWPFLSMSIYTHIVIKSVKIENTFLQEALHDCFYKWEECENAFHNNHTDKAFFQYENTSDLKNGHIVKWLITLMILFTSLITSVNMQVLWKKEECENTYYIDHIYMAFY